MTTKSKKAAGERIVFDGTEACIERIREAVGDCHIEPLGSNPQAVIIDVFDGETNHAVQLHPGEVLLVKEDEIVNAGGATNEELAAIQPEATPSRSEPVVVDSAVDVDPVDPEK